MNTEEIPTTIGTYIDRESFEKAVEKLGEEAPLEITQMVAALIGLAEDTLEESKSFLSEGYETSAEEYELKAKNYKNSVEALCEIWRD